MADIPADRAFQPRAPHSKRATSRPISADAKLMQELTEILPYLTAEDRQALLKYVRSLAARHPRVIQAREARARYIAAAVAQAQYEALPDDGSVYATIPGLQGVWAQAKTREGAQAELADVLEGWLTLSLERKRPVPVIAGIDLNPPS